MGGIDGGLRVTDKLWSMDNIAEYLGVGKDLVRKRLICKGNFPKAIVLPTGGSRGSHRRWVPAEVKKWVLKHRG